MHSAHPTTHTLTNATADTPAFEVQDASAILGQKYPVRPLSQRARATEYRAIVCEYHAIAVLIQSHTLARSNHAPVALHALSRLQRQNVRCGRCVTHGVLCPSPKHSCLAKDSLLVDRRTSLLPCTGTDGVELGRRGSNDGAPDVRNATICCREEFRPMPQHIAMHDVGGNLIRGDRFSLVLFDVPSGEIGRSL